MSEHPAAQFARALFEPDDIIEVRVIRPKSDRRHEHEKPVSKWLAAGEVSTVDTWMTEKNRDGWNIYIGANPRRRAGGRTNKDVPLARCVFVDFDNLTREDFVEEAAERVAAANLPDPTMMVATGHGVHAWWRLDAPVPAEHLEAWSAAQRRLITVLDADDKIHDPARIMRVPGFTNHKPPVAHAAIIATRDARYGWDVFGISPSTYHIGDGNRCDTMRTDVNRCDKSVPSSLNRCDKAVAGGVDAEHPAAAAIIAATLPSGPDQRRLKVAQLAWRLRGAAAVQGWPAEPYAYLGVFWAWWREAVGKVNHKAGDETLTEFCDAWARYDPAKVGGELDAAFRWAQSQPAPPGLETHPIRSVAVLARMFEHLAKLTEDRTCWAGERQIAVPFGVSQPTVNAWIRSLLELGVLRVEAEMVSPREKGKKPRSRTYRFVGYANL